MRELEAQNLARSIKLKTDIDLFKKTRRAEHVYCRSIFNHILYTKHKWGLTRIARFYKANGYKSYDHATVFHSINRYNSYVTQYPELTIFLEGIDEAYNNRDTRLTEICSRLTSLNDEELTQIYGIVCEAYRRYIFKNTFHNKNPLDQETYRHRKNKYIKLSEQKGV